MCLRVRALRGPALPGRVLAASVLLFATRDAYAIDPFEIQVYDGTANAPGVPGLELHVNRVFVGQTTALPPELPQDQQTHFTLEPSIGVTPWWELGAYFQTALRGDGTFDYAGVKFRSKFVSPPGWHPHLRLGVNLEVSVLPEAYDRNRWGSELRPIVAWEDERWLFAVNPIVDVPLAGPDWHSGPTFEPALMAKVKIGGVVALGPEYYAAFGPIASLAGWQGEQHYLYEAIDVLALHRIEINVGVGEGLTSSSNTFVAKMILGYSWDRDEEDALPAAPTALAHRFPRRW